MNCLVCVNPFQTVNIFPALIRSVLCPCWECGAKRGKSIGGKTERIFGLSLPKPCVFISSCALHTPTRSPQAPTPSHVFCSHVYIYVQVPQFLLQAGYGRVACTQPRRISAMGLCRRVSRGPLGGASREKTVGGILPRYRGCSRRFQEVSELLT